MYVLIAVKFKRWCQFNERGKKNACWIVIMERGQNVITFPRETNTIKGKLQKHTIEDVSRRKSSTRWKQNDTNKQLAGEHGCSGWEKRLMPLMFLLALLLKHLPVWRINSGFCPKNVWSIFRSILDFSLLKLNGNLIVALLCDEEK